MTLGITAGLTAAAIWGGMYVVSKVVLETIPPFILLSMRLILGAIALAIAVGLRPTGVISRRQRLIAMGVGFIGYGLSLGMQFVGTHLSTAANAALVTSASPAFILIFAALIIGERLSFSRVAALGLATIGVAAVIDPRQALLGSETALGNIILVGAALTWGLYSVLAKYASRDQSVLSLSFWSFLGGLPLSLPMPAWEWRLNDLQALTWPIVLGILYLGLISTALAMFLWNQSLAMLDAGLVSILFFAQPVVGAGLGALLLHETLGPGFWIGALFIAAGVLLAARGEAAPQAA